jgi:TonB family protein
MRKKFATLIYLLFLFSYSSFGAPTSVDIKKLSISFQPDADAYFPTYSKRHGEQGVVVVRLAIDELGNVTDTSILQSSTFPRLDRAAVDIGSNYKFNPYLVDGNPIKISTNIMVKFNLKLPEGFKDAFLVNFDKLTVSSTPTQDYYYPAESKAAKEEGAVNLKLLIDANGNVVEAVPFEKSTEYERLRNAAIEIAKQTKFEPYFLNGKAIIVQTLTTVSFPPKGSAK